jgi:hypothetical protein
MKFAHIVDGEWVAYDYGNRYCRQTARGQTRLVIGPSKGHVDLMLELAQEFADEPIYVMLVLLVPNAEAHEAGRYQSSAFETHAEVAQFVSSFRDYFESDGGHHFWVASTEGQRMVIYDQHNVLFAYGPIEKYEQRLIERGFREEKFWFPAPHGHGYGGINEVHEARLLAAEEWERFPLQPGDDWT